MIEILVLRLYAWFATQNKYYFKFIVQNDVLMMWRR